MGGREGARLANSDSAGAAAVPLSFLLDLLGGPVGPEEGEDGPAKLIAMEEEPSGWRMAAREGRGWYRTGLRLRRGMAMIDLRLDARA